MKWFGRKQKDDQQDDEMTKKSLMKPKFNGLAGKFFNLSPHPLTLYWYEYCIFIYFSDLKLKILIQEYVL